MRISDWSSDVCSSDLGVRVVDCRTGEDATVPASALDLGYRRSVIRAGQVVLRATLGLARDEAGTGSETLSEVVRWRRAHQPGGQNAGPVFTNPDGDSAGRPIDLAGCTGLRRGSAQVSTKHANLLQAAAGGRADDAHAVTSPARDTR